MPTDEHTALVAIREDIATAEWAIENSLEPLTIEGIEMAWVDVLAYYKRCERRYVANMGHGHNRLELPASQSRTYQSPGLRIRPDERIRAKGRVLSHDDLIRHNRQLADLLRWEQWWETKRDREKRNRRNRKRRSRRKR